MDADTWDSSNMEVALSILDSLEFNQEELSGAICEYSEESFIEEYSLAVSAKNITSSGATIVFERTDPSITDELTFGEEFSIEKKVNDEWLEAEIVVGRGEKTKGYYCGKVHFILKGRIKVLVLPFCVLSVNNV